jgi:hypothetical protein
MPQHLSSHHDLDVGKNCSPCGKMLSMTHRNDPIQKKPSNHLDCYTEGDIVIDLELKKCLTIRLKIAIPP